MQLNTLKPVRGSRKKKKRLGRGIGSGSGKTCGRGHKGQKSRSGGRVKPGFEGGQMPLQRRLPKFGFTSRVSLFRQEVPVYALNVLVRELQVDTVNLEVLKKAGLIRKTTRYVKIILSGELAYPLTIKGVGVRVTKGAKAHIESKGGKVEYMDNQLKKTEAV